MLDAEWIFDFFARFGFPDQVALDAVQYPINASRELLSMNNCYSWAVNDLFLHGISYQEVCDCNYAPWLGESTGVRRTKWNLNTLNRDIIKYASDDGAEFISLDKSADYKSGFIQIFLASDINGVGHAYRQHKDGLWSHKPGPGKLVCGLDDINGARVPIENPYTCNRYDYVIPIGFFRFPVGIQIGIKAFENNLYKICKDKQFTNYLSETQCLRDRCAKLNIKMEKYIKGQHWFNSPEFKSVYEEYLSTKQEFEKIIVRYKNVVNRHNLLSSR